MGSLTFVAIERFSIVKYFLEISETARESRHKLLLFKDL